MGRFKTILHPTDFSPHSQHAFQMASHLAADSGARLLVLHVLEQPVIVASGTMMAPMPTGPSAELRQMACEQLAKIKPEDSSVAVEHITEEGDPVTAILDVAQERDCDLIVIGSHGRTGLGRLLMGSVAEQIVRRAACAVLTVKLPQAAEKPRVKTARKEPTKTH